MSLAAITTVKYHESALAFPSNHDRGMTIAQLDLSNRPARGVNLPENYRRGAIADIGALLSHKRLSTTPRYSHVNIAYLREHLAHHPCVRCLAGAPGDI